MGNEHIEIDDNLRAFIEAQGQIALTNVLMKLNRKQSAGPARADAAGERPITFVVADRSDSEVQCRQRRSTGRVHADRWTDESEAV